MPMSQIDSLASMYIYKECHRQNNITIEKTNKKIKIKKIKKLTSNE